MVCNDSLNTNTISIKIIHFYCSKNIIQHTDDSLCEKKF